MSALAHTMPRPACFEAAVEQLPHADLSTLVERKLAQAVRRARQAPFYRARLSPWRDPGERLSAAHFQELVPLTSKQDLREQREAIWHRSASRQTNLLLATSGTTGARVALPYSAADLRKWFALVARTLWTNGLRPDDIAILPVPISLFTGGHAMLGGLLRLGCTVLPTGPTPPPVMADILNGGLGAAPTAVVSLPSYMLRLLEALPAHGCDPASCALRIGSFGAEAWSEAARSRLEAGYRLRAMDSYGIGEICGPGIAAECEYRDGMHVWEDAFFAEIVDPYTDEPVPDGTPGELVLTPLFRQAFPLLRYRTGDEAFLIPEPCACGRTHRRMSRIARRLDNVLIFSGVNIDPGDMEGILYGFSWLGNEFYLAAAGEHCDMLAVHVERHHTLPMPADAEQQIMDAIRRYYPVRITVHLHDAGQMERAPGKAQRIRG
jgi:phenylacetate-CoA ligase